MAQAFRDACAGTAVSEARNMYVEEMKLKTLVFAALQEKFGKMHG